MFRSDKISPHIPHRDSRASVSSSHTAIWYILSHLLPTPLFCHIVSYRPAEKQGLFAGRRAGVRQQKVSRKESSAGTSQSSASSRQACLHRHESNFPCFWERISRKQEEKN